jgi:hypothetical protein
MRVIVIPKELFCEIQKSTIFRRRRKIEDSWRKLSEVEILWGARTYNVHKMESYLLWINEEELATALQETHQMIYYRTLKKCTMHCCSYLTNLLLLRKTTNYCSSTDQLLLMHCHEQLLVGYRAIIGRSTNYWSVNGQ